ncbi:MAG: sulfotransferase family protein [Wenzhouxiangella sp.]
MFDFRAFLRFLRHWYLRAPWTRRRVAVAAAFVLVVPLVEVLIWMSLAADKLFFRGFVRQQVTAPVFIVGNPRSGTTFLHRLLALDEARFSTMSMGEVLFAPSVTLRAAGGAIAALDRGLGRIFSRLRRKTEASWQERNVMHKVSLDAPEEDDYLLLHAWSALTVGLSSGMLNEARAYTFFDQRIPAHRRDRIMAFYRRMVQRHLYARSGATSYLAKNPALTPKLATLFGHFPDARVICLVRNPLEMVPSYLSMMQFSWHAVGLNGDDPALREYVIEMAKHWYSYPRRVLRDLPPDRYIFVRYEELVADPAATVRRIYSHFNHEPDEDFASRLEQEASRSRGFSSRHDYSLDALGLSEERLLAEFSDVMEDLGYAPAAQTPPVPAAPSQKS